jgi:Gpi18-like mannosyltransferase
MLEDPQIARSSWRAVEAIQETPLHQKLLFVVGVWLLSRILILVLMQGIAPALPLAPANHSLPPVGYVFPHQPTMGWGLFTHWDGKWYEMIATKGYEYGADHATKRYSVSFPPLYSLVCWGVMTVFRLPFEVAGTIVNNVTFLAALLLMYVWVESQYGTKVAQWSAIALAWCPYSLYGTVAYTEGLFLLTTTAALRSFDRQHYFWASFWGALATVTRFFGTTLIPAFLLVAWKQKRGAIAYISALGVGVSWLVLMAYCGWKFGDPFAPFNSQLAWSTGQETWKHVSGTLLLRRGLSWNSLPDYLDCLLKVFMFFGGGYLFWRFRQKLNFMTLAYGFCYLGILFSSFSTAEISRYSYANIALSIALGLFLATHSRWRLLILGLFLIKLIELVIRFTWWYTAM